MVAFTLIGCHDREFTVRGIERAVPGESTGV